MRLLLAAALGLALTAPGPGAAPAATAPKVHTVTIDASRFEPATLTVAAGDTVIWKNIDMFPHTATSTVGVFDSKEIKPGKAWKFVVPKKGLFEYICTLHPAMRGAVRVR